MKKTKQIKNGKGKKLALGVVGLLVLGALFGGSDGTDAPAQDTSVSNQEQVSVQDSATNEEVKQEVQTWKAGTYKVGEEIPAGVYFVESKNGFGYVASLKDTTGELGTIITNDTVKTHSFIEVHDGEYLEVKGATIKKSEEVESIQAIDGQLQEGTYRVGIDLPAGEYKINMEENSVMGYVGVYSDMTGALGTIVTNEVLDGSTYITVSDGQYLKVSGATIQLN